ncbi:hypothetical protein C4568_04750 [Candidatus Parcubacteria bacterium]|nr:MAG: hypothetical protein C4568_04750 [Candidatus Parcubacteria bacterium]
MVRQLQALVIVLVMLLCSFPLYVLAANVFGGRVGASIPCFNVAIWNSVGAPRGGIYIWTPATRTYPYGPPSSGRYVLGLYGIPYFCIVTIAPLFVLPGISMTMLGTSR